MDRDAAPAALIEALADTPRRIEAAAAGLKPEECVVPPAPGEWSLNEVLWHIRVTADVYDEQVVRILEEDTPGWRHVSPRARMKKARYDQVPFAESLASLADQRSALVTRLRGLAPGEWDRIALVRLARDRERRLTLHERIRVMSAHEQVHCDQAERTADTIRERSMTS